MKIDRVTITGADDSTPHSMLWKLADRYPFAEWGILVSERSIKNGGPRFPSTKWIEGLIHTLHARSLNLSVHVCGSWVRRVCAGDWSWCAENPIVDKLLLYASRIQLNFHSYKHSIVMPDFAFGIGQWKDAATEVILQGDGVNTDIILQARDAVGSGVSVLHDASGGAGDLPECWPAPIADMRNGYAGGLSADNVVDELHSIEQIVGDDTVWIDAETRLRLLDNSELSEAAVERYLKAAEPWVTL